MAGGRDRGGFISFLLLLLPFSFGFGWGVGEGVGGGWIIRSALGRFGPSFLFHAPPDTMMIKYSFFEPSSHAIGGPNNDDNREGEGQRVRNRIIQKMTHREGLKKKAIDNGESVEDWDRIVLAGKKVRQQQQQSPSGAMSVMEES